MAGKNYHKTQNAALKQYSGIEAGELPFFHQKDILPFFFFPLFVMINSLHEPFTP